MSRFAAVVSTVLFGVPLAVAAPASSADAICAMGGALVVVEVDKGKAMAWAAGLGKKDVSDADTADWTVLALSTADQGIAILLGPHSVFFGVAGRGGEVYPREIERAFGKDLGKLREAVGKTMADLWKAGVARIAASDVQALADAAGLGSLEKTGGSWVLKTQDCQAVDLPASGL